MLDIRNVERWMARIDRFIDKAGLWLMGFTILYVGIHLVVAIMRGRL